MRCIILIHEISRIPILAIVDADPYGIDILSVYKYGSKGMLHEQDTLTASRLKWMGVMTSELHESVLSHTSPSERPNVLLDMV